MQGHPTGRFAGLRGAGGPGREHEALSRADTICGGSDEIPLAVSRKRRCARRAGWGC